MHYYEVGIGVEKHWKSGVFTYSCNTEIEENTIVSVPFGKQKKTGVVIGAVKKPSFAVKDIIKILEIKLSKQTVDFMNWYGTYYSAENSQVYSQFLPGYLTLNLKPDNLEKQSKISLPKLSVDQTNAIEKIRNTHRPSVLHGITGSGKTRIYTHLLIEQLEKGRDGLLLYPEIALTSQIVNELQKYAPVVVFHSQLTSSERSRLWYTVAGKHDPCIIIGPRSALFLPYENLGVVILDEAHESSYKQENDIRYGSIYTAAGLCSAHNSKLVIGSATPPIAETEHILSRGGNLVCLHEKAVKTESSDKKTIIIDSKHKSNFSKHPLMSDELISAIEKSLKSSQQALLFLNRRGTAKLVMCSSEECDWQAECEHCDLPMTYHHDSYSLICHTCGRKSTMPSNCPSCGSKTHLKSLGSKAIFEDISKLFPQAKIGRYDSDTSKTDSFSQNYNDILSGSVDILVGTQQLVKGLDLPKLSTIGILNADLSLHFPDFTSQERTFQLITQAMGRVGRGHNKGTVVVQTYLPTSPVMSWSINEDWHSFRQEELKERGIHSFPPYSFYAKLIFRDKSYEKAEKRADLCKNNISTEKINIDGPLPSFHLKRGGFYFVQLLIKAKSRSRLLESLKKVPKDTIIDLDPSTLL